MKRSKVALNHAGDGHLVLNVEFHITLKSRGKSLLNGARDFVICKISQIFQRF